jgi:NADH-quinone oxidoreductase subunit G
MPPRWRQPRAYRKEEKLALVVLENDLYRRAPAAALMPPSTDRLQHLLVIDHQETTTARRRTWCCLPPVLPKATVPGQHGRPRPALLPGLCPCLLQRRHSVRELALAGCLQGPATRSVRWNTFDDVSRDCAASAPLLTTMGEAANAACAFAA